MAFLKRTRTTRFLFFLFADIILISLSIYLAFLLRFDGHIPQEYLESGAVQKAMAGAVVFCLPFFYFFGLYSFSWSYASTQELLSLFKASTIGYLFLIFALFFSKEFYFLVGFPRSVFFISYFLVFIFCGAVRFSKRIYLRAQGRAKSEEREKTLIVGAGDAAEQIVRSISSSANTPYFPVGLVDDSKIKQGITIHGLKVLGKIADIPQVVSDNKITQLIVALPSVGNKIIKQAVELGRKAGIKKIKIAPALSEIIKGKISFENLKNIDVEDLLGRDQVLQDTKQIDAFIKNRIVLITGAAGSIGSELCRQTAKFKPSLLLLLDQDETGIFNISNELSANSALKTVSLVADITDAKRMGEIFSQYRPNIVFHAAAYKHVPLMEENAGEAVKNNIFGTETLAKTSLEFGVEKFIFISTDKAVNPVSVMGATKRAGEMVCQMFSLKGQTKFISVRFGNVLNSRGSVIPIFSEQIRRGGPVEVTHPEMKRFFMLTSEACLLVMQSGAIGQGGEIFVLDMGKPIKILDLAKEMIRLSGFEPDKDIAIVFKGTRPGEKLFEEILTAEEGVSATKSQRIFVAKQSYVDEKKLDADLETIKNAILEGKKERAVEILKQTVNI